jgi:uncharacterized protein YkwD
LVLAFGLDGTRLHGGMSWQEEWLTRFSRERARSGAPPLRFSPALTQVAQRQADEIARSGRRLRSPSSRFVTEGLRQVGYSAHDWHEVFALSGEEPEAVAEERSLDGRFRDLGVGAAEVDGYTFYVLLFGWHQGDYFAGVTAPLGDRERVAAEMLSRVNEVRRQAGLPPLRSNRLLDRVSQEHAEDMLARAYFGHQSPEGLGPTERARADGYLAGIGENLVEQRYTVKDALDAWMSSPGHRNNILDPDCRDLGLGLAIGAGYDAAPGGYRVVWVQSFGRG